MVVLAGAGGICAGAGQAVEPVVAEGLGLGSVDAVGDGGDVTGIIVGVAEVLQVGAAAASTADSSEESDIARAASKAA